MRFLIKILIYAIGIVVTAYLLPGVHIAGPIDILVLAVVLIVLRALVKPILVFLTMPLTVLTLGLFLLIVNTIIILIADWLVAGFVVDDFAWALLFSLILSAIVWVLDALEGPEKHR